MVKKHTLQHCKKNIALSFLLVLLSIIFLSGCVYNDDNIPSGLALGEEMYPYAVRLSWTGSPADSQTVSWLSNSFFSVSYLEYYEEGQTAENAILLEANAVSIFDGVASFSVELDGLKPAATYFYRVGRPGIWSEEASFNTAAGEGAFSFLYLGDTQKDIDSAEGYSVFESLLANANQNTQTDFVLIAGDLVNDGSDYDEWREFFAAGKNAFANLSLMPAMGNHDGGKGYRDIFALPQNGAEDSKEHFYSFDYNNTHFTILDSSTLFLESNLQWLAEDLAVTDKAWKIVMLHHPVYVSQLNAKEVLRSQELQNTLAPILEVNGVDLVLMGHQHSYMRTYPLKEQKPAADGKGIVYLMSVSNNKLYTNDPADYIAKQLAGVPVYTEIAVTDSAISLKTFSAENVLVDEYIINK